MVMDHNGCSSDDEIVEKVISVEEKHREAKKRVKDVGLVGVLEVHKAFQPVHICFDRVDDSFEPIFLDPEFIS